MNLVDEIAKMTGIKKPDQTILQDFENKINLEKEKRTKDYLEESRLQTEKSDYIKSLNKDNDFDPQPILDKLNQELKFKYFKDHNYLLIIKNINGIFKDYEDKICLRFEYYEYYKNNNRIAIELMEEEYQLFTFLEFEFKEANKSILDMISFYENILKEENDND